LHRLKTVQRLISSGQDADNPLMGLSWTARGDYNLLLLANRGVNHAPDFAKVAMYVREIDRRICPFVQIDRPSRLRRWLLSGRPTLAFSPPPLTHFHPRRGRVFQGIPLAKSEEYAALAAAGVDVPCYKLITEHDQPDCTELGPYVVVKPDRGGRGAKIRIMRSSRVRWEPQDTRIAGHSDSLLAQEFIYTGPWPLSYRVTTLFGQVLWSLKVEASHERAPLPGPDAFRKNPGQNVVSNSKGCVMSLNFDEQVIRFAEEAHRAVPHIPLLGVDVIRRLPDGKLFVVELNASGWVWHFSSPLGLRAQRKFGFSLESQFDGLRKAARILAQKTVELAA
jgi:hypothetical protein